MNWPLLLHVVERLEGLVGKLPASIQKPILNELTPLKELFLQQRPPRFLIISSSARSGSQLVSNLFPGFAAAEAREILSANRLWREYTLADRGTVSILDLRDENIAARTDIEQQLQTEPADVVYLFDDEHERRKIRKNVIENVATALAWNDRSGRNTGLIAAVVAPVTTASPRNKPSGQSEAGERAARLQAALESNSETSDRFSRVFRIRPERELDREAKAFLSTLAQQLPNEARLEMARISGDREAQRDIAQLLVKSTTAICTAIGAQPIPLADLPILTSLQLIMVSGIMYISGRERSLRAATEFLTALGANVGAGMLFREGARAILKFFPGWGNLVCGMVAGAGTYAIGRAAVAYFLEGVSLKEARRTYLAGRKKRDRPALPPPNSGQKGDGQLEKSPSRRLRLRR